MLNLDDSFVSRIRDRVADGVAVRYFGVDASIADRLPELQEQDVRFEDDFVATGRRARRTGCSSRATSAPSRCCSVATVGAGRPARSARWSSSSAGWPR